MSKVTPEELAEAARRDAKLKADRARILAEQREADRKAAKEEQARVNSDRQTKRKK